MMFCFETLLIQNQLCGESTCSVIEVQIPILSPRKLVIRPFISPLLFEFKKVGGGGEGGWGGRVSRVKMIGAKRLRVFSLEKKKLVYRICHCNAYDLF